METVRKINGYEFIPYRHNEIADDVIIKRSHDFYTLMKKRRTIRFFSERTVPAMVIENILRTASSAPSGAHRQPWTFCVVGDTALKKQIRQAAEREEFENYHGRMSEEWMNDLRPFQTDWNKEFLEVAPYLIIVFKKIYDKGESGAKRNNYYVSESVGIACGFLLAAIHSAGLAALTHTPSPMNFLTKILSRPENERPFLVIPVGHPAPDCYVPKLSRKEMKDVSVWF